jgi:hypothetical protein
MASAWAAALVLAALALLVADVAAVRVKSSEGVKTRGARRLNCHPSAHSVARTAETRYSGLKDRFPTQVLAALPKRVRFQQVKDQAGATGLCGPALVRCQNGICKDNKCFCNNGFSGDDCSQGACPPCAPYQAGRSLWLCVCSVWCAQRLFAAVTARPLSTARASATMAGRARVASWSRAPASRTRTRAPATASACTIKADTPLVSASTARAAPSATKVGRRWRVQGEGLRC